MHNFLGMGDPNALAHMKNLERLRFNARLSRIVLLASIPLILLCISGLGFFLGLIPAALIALGVGILERNARNKYSRYFNDTIVKQTLSEAFENVRYYPARGLDLGYLEEIKFFSKKDKVSGDGHIEADYHGKHFAWCDLWVRRKEISHDSSDSWKTIFPGQMMRFDVAPEFPGPVQVLRQDFWQAQKMPGLERWHRDGSADDEFNKYFVVCARQPEEGMAVLTPKVIQGILRLNGWLGMPWALLFIERRIYVFIRSKRNSFDVSGASDIPIQQEIALLHKDIDFIVGFLETMDFGLQPGPPHVEPLQGTS